MTTYAKPIYVPEIAMNHTIKKSAVPAPKNISNLRNHPFTHPRASRSSNRSPPPTMCDMIDTHIMSTSTAHISELMSRLRLLRFDRSLAAPPTASDEPEHLMWLPPADHNRYRNPDHSDSNTDGSDNDTGLFSG